MLWENAGGWRPNRLYDLSILSQDGTSHQFLQSHGPVGLKVIVKPTSVEGGTSRAMKKVCVFDAFAAHSFFFFICMWPSYLVIKTVTSPLS